MSQSYQNSTQVAIPPELVAIDQWLAYRAVPKPNGKINKPPIDANTGRAGSSTNPATWSTYELAATRSPVGAAFVLTHDDPYFALDIDECVDPETGAITPEAQAIVDRFSIYWEISYSKTGLRGIGRGVIPKDGCKKPNLEVYDHARLVVMTGRTLPGHETIRNCQRELTAWHNEVWPIEPARPVPPPSTPSASNSLNLDDLLTKAFGAKNGDKARRLHEGDISGYPESQNDPGFSSEADLALAGYYCFWTQDDGLVAEAMRSSKLYRKKLDRQDYLDRTIQRVRTNQTARYDPGYGHRAPLPMIVPPVAVGATCDEQLKHAQDTIVLLSAQLQDARQTITTREGVIVRERDLRIAAEERANTLAIERSGILHILRNGDLGAERLTGFAIALDLHARMANGEQPTPSGFKAPAKRYAEMTGQSEGTVAKHMRLLSKDPKTGEGKDLIPKRVVRETTKRQIDGETIDHSTGEIHIERETVRGLRDVNYLEVPDGKVINLIDRLRSYQRPEGETGHGGKRDARPACEHHPDAGTYTVKHEHIECAACHAILKKSVPKTTYHPVEDPADLEDESTGSKMTPVTKSVVNHLLSGSKMTPEPDDPQAADATGSIMQPDPLESHDHRGQRLTFSEPRESRACWECHGPLEDGQTALCRSCSAASRRRAEQAERVRHAGTLRCVQCGDPTPSRQDSYCHRHGGRSAAGMVAS